MLQLKCAYCGGDLTLTPEGEWVCTVCGTVQFPHLYLAPLRPEPQAALIHPLKKAVVYLLRRHANCRGVFFITPRLVHKYGAEYRRKYVEMLAKCSGMKIVDGLLAVPCREIPQVLRRLELC